MTPERKYRSALFVVLAVNLPILVFVIYAVDISWSSLLGYVAFSVVFDGVFLKLFGARRRPAPMANEQQEAAQQGAATDKPAQ